MIRCRQLCFVLLASIAVAQFQYKCWLRDHEMRLRGGIHRCQDEYSFDGPDSVRIGSICQTQDGCWHQCKLSPDFLNSRFDAVSSVPARCSVKPMCSKVSNVMWHRNEHVIDFCEFSEEGALKCTTGQAINYGLSNYTYRQDHCVFECVGPEKWMLVENESDAACVYSGCLVHPSKLLGSKCSDGKDYDSEKIYPINTVCSPWSGCAYKCTNKDEWTPVTDESNDPNACLEVGAPQPLQFTDEMIERGVDRCSTTDTNCETNDGCLFERERKDPETKEQWVLIDKPVQAYCHTTEKITCGNFNEEMNERRVVSCNRGWRNNDGNAVEVTSNLKLIGTRCETADYCKYECVGQDQWQLAEDERLPSYCQEPATGPCMRFNEQMKQYGIKQCGTLNGTAMCWTKNNRRYECGADGWDGPYCEKEN